MNTELKPTHTPGPWFAGVYNVPLYDTGEYELQVTVGSQSAKAICDCPIFTSRIDATEEEVIANAALIAAAPDLLKCCEQMLEWEKKGFDAPMSVSQILVEMKAAIAKATTTPTPQ